jgi:hypothetical protein
LASIFATSKLGLAGLFDEVRSKDRICKYEGPIGASDTDEKHIDGARGLRSDIT